MVETAAFLSGHNSILPGYIVSVIFRRSLHIQLTA